MEQRLAGWPIEVVFAALFVIAMLRGQLVYWLGRSLTSMSLRGARTGRRARLAAWLDDSGVDHGARLLRRIGLVAVPLCYVTVGLQSAVMAAAGVLRIEAWKYTLATIPGALAWATIYSTIGWALWEAALLTVAGSPWGIALLAALLVLVVVLVRRARRRTPPPSSAGTAGPDASGRTGR